MLTDRYIQAGPFTYMHNTIYKFNNRTTIQPYNADLVHDHGLCKQCDENWEILHIEQELKPHLLHSRPVYSPHHHLDSPISPPYLCLWRSLPERQVQSTTMLTLPTPPWRTEKFSLPPPPQRAPMMYDPGDARGGAYVARSVHQGSPG